MSNIIVMAFSPRNIVGCFLKKKPYKGRVTGIGVRAGGARGAAAPPKFGQLRFFGQQEKFG